MNISEKFCLKWNDFKDNINSTFETLRKDLDLSDVTLVCEDLQQVEAHKIILAASRPFFTNVFKNNKHPHPLIYMRGMKSEDLVAILDFLYYGEANIYQANLENFLNIAEELKLRGLQTGTKEDKVAVPTIHDSAKTEHQNYIKAESLGKLTDPYSEDRTLAVSEQSLSGDFDGLDAQIRTMMTLGQTTTKEGKKKYQCTVCGKEAPHSQIKDHIEANHLEGVFVPCNFCEKTFRSRSALKWHNNKNHNRLFTSQ